MDATSDFANDFFMLQAMLQENVARQIVGNCSSFCLIYENGLNIAFFGEKRTEQFMPYDHYADRNILFILCQVT